MSATLPVVLSHFNLPAGTLSRLAAEFPQCEFIDAREPQVLEKHWRRAAIAYGYGPSAAKLGEAAALQWFQLASAGVPSDFADAAHARKLTVTNLAGLYGPSIAEHALALMLIVARNLQVAINNQRDRRWDQSVRDTMMDLHGRTLAVVGAGNIGQNIARLGRGMGMRVVGCRRRNLPTPHVDELFPLERLHAMLAEADFVAVAAPLTTRTTGMLGAAEFTAMKPGVRYVNVSRGGIAQEAALLDALRSGKVAAAGLDVYAVEPLPTEHPFWTMPQVVISPHYSGETVNYSTMPIERFIRNLRAWFAKGPLEGRVDCEFGY